MGSQSKEFYKELVDLINRHSVENESDTPDYILAGNIIDYLESYNKVVSERDRWYGFDPSKGTDASLSTPTEG